MENWKIENLKTTHKMIIQLMEHWRIKNRKNIILKNLKTTYKNDKLINSKNDKLEN